MISLSMLKSQDGSRDGSIGASVGESSGEYGGSIVLVNDRRLWVRWFGGGWWGSVVLGKVNPKFWSLNWNTVVWGCKFAVGRDCKGDDVGDRSYSVVYAFWLRSVSCQCRYYYMQLKVTWELVMGNLTYMEKAKGYKSCRLRLEVEERETWKLEWQDLSTFVPRGQRAYFSPFLPKLTKGILCPSTAVFHESQDSTLNVAGSVTLISPRRNSCSLFVSLLVSLFFIKTLMCWCTSEINRRACDIYILSIIWAWTDLLGFVLRLKTISSWHRVIREFRTI